MDSLKIQKKIILDEIDLVEIFKKTQGCSLLYFLL